MVEGWTITGEQTSTSTETIGLRVRGVERFWGVLLHASWAQMEVLHIV